MTNQAWIERQSATPEARREYEQERLVLWATEMICEAMEASGQSKADIARKLGFSRAHITSLLSGGRNMTLRTLADLGWALDQRVSVAFEPLRDGAFISTPMQIVHRVRQKLVHTEEFDHASGQRVTAVGDVPDPLAA
jgi:transcriptional regulator with XRE-family HTH domain